MAGAHCATNATFLLSFANATPIPRKPLVFASSIPTPSPYPSKLTKRKNYLRRKLLKTLTKPYPHPLLPESTSANPIIPIESPYEEQHECPSVADEELKESESDEFVHSETSNSAAVIDGSVGNFSTRSVLKFGFYLVGAFVFQTVCAVWILGSANSDHEDGKLDSENKTTVLELDVGGNDKAESSFLLNGSGNSFHGKLGIDESELEEKIVEIRAMARDARERERLKSKEQGLDDEKVVIKTGIEKEVDSRLVKLRKRLQNSLKKSQLSSVSYLGKDGNAQDRVDKNDLDDTEANGALMFKKKFKFKGPETNPSNKPKGFQGSADGSVTKMKKAISVPDDETLRDASVGNNDAELLDKDQQLDLPNGDIQGSVSMHSEDYGAEKAPLEEDKPMGTTRKKLGKQRGRSKSGKGTRMRKTEPRIGNSLEAQNFRGFAKETQDADAMSNKGDVLSRNGSLKGRKVGNRKPAYELGNKKSHTDTDLWWLGLPYVLAILMRRGHDGEGPQGLFTLKSTSHFNGDTSYTVAFEDRGDATNFCYLLQSFFEGLGDFSADVVPLLVKELDEAVKSHMKKVLVVKKGQLQLYAGQPLADVEMALSSLVGQS